MIFDHFGRKLPNRKFTRAFVGDKTLRSAWLVPDEFTVILCTWWKELRSAIFRDITQHIVAIPYHSLHSAPRANVGKELLLYVAYKIREERRSCLLHCNSLKSRMVGDFSWRIINVFACVEARRYVKILRHWMLSHVICSQKRATAQKRSSAQSLNFVQ